MNYTNYILLIILSVSCGIDSDTSRKEINESNERAIASLLSKLRDVRVDTLEIYSTDELESPNFAFRGTELDSTEISLLPTKVRFGDNPFYGCYKFPLDSIRFGLIIRTPSEYSSSSIKLFILDNSLKRILELYIELAESTGDAGYSLTKTSLILKEDEKLKYLIWQHDSEDMSVENENDTTIQTSDYLHLVTFGKGKFDTLNSDKASLIEKFRMLTKRAD